MPKSTAERLATIDGDALSIALRRILKDRPACADKPAPGELTQATVPARPTPEPARRPDTGVGRAPPEA